MLKIGDIVALNPSKLGTDLQYAVVVNTNGPLYQYLDARTSSKFHSFRSLWNSAECLFALEEVTPVTDLTELEKAIYGV